MQRTDLMDKSEWARIELLRRYRAMTPEQRLHETLQCIDLGRAMHQMAMERLQKEKAAHLAAGD